MNRREFVRTAGGATVALGATGTAAGAQEGGGGNESGGGDGGGQPDYGNWFSDVGNYEGSTVDATGQDEVTVTVGAEGNSGPNAFAPPAVHVDNGATVLFEWTGNGGHNVVHDGGEFESGDPVSEAGVNFEHTFGEDGIYKYYCTPHQGLGMKGAIVVGSDYPTTNPSAGPQTIDPHEAGVPIQPHFVGIATGLAILVSLVFTFFTLKYGESPNTKGGNN